MPKVILTEQQRDQETVENIIRKYAGAQRISLPTLAKKIPISESQIYKRLNYPDTFIRWELKRICKILHIPDEEKLLLL